MQIRGFGKVPALLLSIVFLFCISGTAAGHVQLNGYTIDVKGQEPTVPADLAPSVDGKYKKWIVQFNGPVQEADKKALVDLGCRVGDYLPDFAFIVTMDNKTRKKVEQLSFVNGIIRYKPAYKVEKKLKDDSGAVIVEKGMKIKLAIKLDGKDSQPVVLSEVHKKKGKVLDVSNDIVRIEVEQADISSFAAIEEVIWIEEAIDLKLLNDTSKWTIQTYLSGNTRIWDKGLHGEGQIVGIGDSGLDHDMPWFRDPAGTSIGPMHRKVVGYDTTYGDDYDADYPGHGTHVAGIVGGDRTPVDGLSTANGMAPKSKFFMQDLTPGSDTHVYPPSDLGLLFITAYNAGARLHTNSWGGVGNSYNSTSMSADRFMWDHKDFLALFANGNSGPSAGTVGYPASAKNVVSVGASLNGTGAESMASFSSHGPTADGRIKPTVTAPGDGVTEGAGIISADSDGVKNSNNSGTIAMRGTSMATPTTAGAAALIRQYYTDGYYPGGSANSANAFTPSAALIKATLINSAQNMAGNYTDGPIPSTGQGWGRINLSNTFTFTEDTKTLEVHDISTGLATGESRSLTYYTDSTQSLKITLVWTDYPGTIGAAKALVNDLDLTVVAPDGVTRYLGNVFTNGASATGGSADRLNVEEQVLIRTPATGTYTVTVTGYNVPSGPQPFAVVITGASNVVSKGSLSLNKTRYNGSATAEIRVADRDLDMDSTAVEEIFVSIKSTTEPEGELVRLVETGPNTAVFIGSIKLNAGAVVPGDGIIEVADGDVLTATYYDADDGSGSPAVVTANARADLSAPVLSVISANAEESTATISWDTDEPADSLINYGETADRGIVASTRDLVTAHTLSVGNLKEGKTYYYSLSSTDQAGNTGIDDNGGSLYTFTTQNTPPDLTVYSSNGSDTYSASTKIYGTAVDYSGIASITVNGTAVPRRSTDGYYELEVALAPGENNFTVTAIDGVGNPREMTAIITRLQAPDLALLDVSGPGTGLAGGTITIADTVINNGPGDALPFPVGLYLSADNVAGTTDISLGSRSVPKLSASGSSTGSTSVTIPISTAPGVYYLCAIAAPGGTLPDADTTNNGRCGSPLSIAAPDLTVAAVSAPSTILTGISTVVTNTATASPNGSGAQAIYVAIYLSADNIITTDDYRIVYRYIASLAPGESNTQDTPFTVSSRAVPPGTYYVGAIVDYQDSIKESDETNNALAGNQITLVGPDLIPTSILGPAETLPGQTVTISDTVTNSSTAASYQFSNGIYLSRDNVITTSDTRIGTRYVGGLSAGASSSADTTIKLSNTLEPGLYYLGMIADCENGVKESDETNNGLTGGLIAVRGPDLVVSQVSAPTSIGVGKPIKITDTISNIGPLPAGFFEVGLYLSQDGVITTSDTRIGSHYVSSVQAGQSSTFSTTVAIPNATPPGTYYIGAIADYSGSINEFDETNNALAGTQIILVGSDLTMTAVSGPASAVTGETMTVSSTAAASTSGGNAGTFKVGIYLSSDNVITTADTFIGARTVYGLASGNSSTASIPVVIPNGLAPGTYYIGAIADYEDAIMESDESNNGLPGNQITIDGPDLTMTALSGPLRVGSGQTIAVSNTVATKGAAAAQFYISFYLSTDELITTADRYIGLRSVSGLAPYGSSAAETVLTIPIGMPPGTYYIGAIADMYQTGDYFWSDKIKESDETNNALAGNQIIVIGPDLSMTAASGPVTVLPGGSITVTNTVAASASGGDAGSSSVGIYLSSDSVITTADTRIGTRTVSSLAAGTTSTADTAVTVPSTLPPGTYYLGAIADYGNAVTESDETNNALAGNQIIVIGPDLSMTAASGPVTAFTGGSITVTNTVAASASGGNAGSSSVGIYLSSDSVITTADTRIGTRTVSSLAAGTSSSADTALVLPLSIGPGSYYIGAIADYANAVTESDETNNALLGNQITLIGPDLSMANVSAPTSASVGGTVTIRNTAAAASGGNPGNFSVGIYLSVDDVITTYDMMIGSRLVTGLTAGSSDTADTAIVLPGSIAPGTYYIGAIADYRNDVKESDETNNALTGNRITIFGPDLTISAVSGPSSAVTGGSITISTTLAASASGGSAGESEIHIYLSADSTVTSSDIYLGSRTVSSLAPGTTNTGSVTALVPQYVTPGTYYIGAIADSGDTVKEPDETNNSSAGNQIAIIGPDLSMTSVSGPSTAALGETIAVTNTVTAAAGGGYPNAFTVGIYLSADAIIDSTDYRVGTRTAGNLAPGQSSTEATAIVIPTTLKRGTYYIGAIADDGNSVKESNEGNNNLTGNTILIKR